MSGELLRARFTFGDESEVRYIATLPAAGDYVTHGRELWLVASAETDDLGLFVVCEPIARVDELTQDLSDAASRSTFRQ